MMKSEAPKIPIDRHRIADFCRRHHIRKFVTASFPKHKSNMPKDDMVYAGHMLDMARKALKLVKGKDRGAYDRDEPLRLALAHLIQVIGEAARA